MSQALSVVLPQGITGLAYYVGEQPSAPLVLGVVDQNGEPALLASVTAVEFVPAGSLPAGTAAVVDPFAGLVSYDFGAPFAVSEILTLQLRLTSTAPAGVDLTTPFSVTVADPADATLLLVTPAEVELWTNTPVTDNDIARAQGIISVACGRDLSDPEWFASIAHSDQYWLRVAVGYQSVNVQQMGNSLPLPHMPGISSVANGDVRVSYTDASAGGITALGNLAQHALSRVSWMRSFRSVQATPFSTRGPAPDPWTTMSVNRGWPA
jgi:hypothetical protein